jgi:hypothetical protein
MAKEVLEMEVKSNIGEVAKDTKKLTTESTKAQKGVGGIGKAFKGMGTAIKAAGIGLVVALLAKLMEVFSKNQTVLDTFNTAMTALSIAFNDLFGFISNSVGNVIEAFKSLFEDPKQKIINLGDAIKANIMERVESAIEMFGFLGKAIKQVFEGDFSGAMDSAKEAYSEYIDVWTGVDNTIGKVSDSIKNATESIKEYVTETLTQADAITQTAKAAGRAEVEFARLNAKYLKDAEIQRQIRDDETKTFEERIEANNKLSKVLDEQAKDQAKQVQVKIDNAQAQFNINKSEENFLELGRAKNEMLELEETITGQLSEQKTNQVGLEKELLETQKEVRAEGLTGLERELQELQDAYDLKLEMARKSGMDIKDIEIQYSKDKKAIIVANVNDQIDAYAGLTNALIGLAGENKELAVASAIIDTFVGANKALGNAPPPLNYINMAAVIATGLANVSTIMSTDVGAGGGGSVAAPSTPAPQMMSGAFDISGGVAPDAMKAFVVTDEMTNSQNQLANIRRRATI